MQENLIERLKDLYIAHQNDELNDKLYEREREKLKSVVDI